MGRAHWKLSYTESSEHGLTLGEIAGAAVESVTSFTDRCGAPRRALLIVPDYTRIHSGAGVIAGEYYRILTEAGCEVQLLAALGTHEMISREQAELMYPAIPYEAILEHHWREDVVRLGVISPEEVSALSEGLFREEIAVEINHLLLDGGYDLILSIGQVVPHEVVGMANYTKNLFVGVGGSDMINKSHMLGGLYGLERIMGHDHSPVREVFDRAFDRYLNDLPICFVQTVCTAREGRTRMHGLFIGEGREVFEEAVALAQKTNIDFVDSGIRKCVVYLDPEEFKSTWIGNKAVYRTRLAVADGGELLILAPGVERFGEDPAIDRLIRKHGYKGRDGVLDKFSQRDKYPELWENMGATAHLIHGSTEGRFDITYAVKNIPEEEIWSVGYEAVSYEEAVKQYNPDKLRYGYNTLPDGEEIYYIPNPAIGLWIDRSRYRE